jgi:hypothetical protein
MISGIPEYERRESSEGKFYEAVYVLQYECNRRYVL